MSGISSPRLGRRCPRPLVAAGSAALVAGLLFLPDASLAQGRWIDIGLSQSYQVPVQGDPSSFELFPANAFGSWGPGNLVYVELLRWPCAQLPDDGPCTSGRLLDAYYGYLDTGTCPCQGQLLLPVTVQVHYDPARVVALGGREVDLSLRHFDDSRQAWVELGSHRVDPGQDLVSGLHLGSARQFYALVLSETPRSEATWGRIKGHWSGS